MKRLCILTLLVLQLACTSLTGQGDDLFEKGLYLEAEKTYSAALQKDANDVKAQEGLQKARTKILDVGLIEVRMLRLGDNFLVAAGKLEDLLEKQVTWNVRFTSGIAQTQADETAEAKKFLHQEMNREVAAGFAERAHWLGRTHKNVLENTGPSPELDDVRMKISALGKKRCSEYQQVPSAKDVFLRTFVSRYCSLFGVSWASRSQVDDPWLFSGVRFSNQYAIQKLNFAGNLNSKRLEGEFIKAFENSPYFNPLARRTLDLKMTGTLSYVDQRRSERRRKNYEVKEDRLETVVSKDDKGNVKKEEVKKKKSVTKVFEYFVTLHDESANIDSMVTGAIADKPYRSHHQGSATHTSESHDESNYAAGVSPVKPKLMDVNAWFAQQFRQATDAFGADLDKMWGQHFCAMIAETVPNPSGKSSGWEIIERCGRVEHANQIVNTFYRNKFHLGYLEFWSLLEDGKSDLKVAH